ncbi:MAG: phytanoyl-CoA dioxygenase family protein [Bacteroidetes bacterium]|nr:phytanoyl-CoA dioxygenase family protein [Bacteroidota bacterium]
MFLNPRYYEEINEKGYIILPFLDETDLKDIKAIYEKYINPKEIVYKDNMFMTSWSLDPKIKIGVSSELKTILDEKCKLYFENFKSTNQLFSIKKENTKKIFPLHQDWSIVDESKYLSLNFWIPIQDTDSKNGAIKIIPQSHKLNNYIRGAGYLFPNFESLNKDISPYLFTTDLKKGEALIFFQRTIHGSHPNKTNNVRNALCFSIYDKDARFQTYFQATKNDPLEIHFPDEDFMFKYDDLQKDSEKNRPSSSYTIDSKPYTIEPITISKIKSVCTRQDNSFFSRAKKLFFN